jgi:hypothetical protein
MLCIQLLGVATDLADQRHHAILHFDANLRRVDSRDMEPFSWTMFATAPCRR